MCRRLFPLIMLTLFLSFVLTLPPFSFSLSLSTPFSLSDRACHHARARARVHTHTHTHTALRTSGTLELYLGTDGRRRYQSARERISTTDGRAPTNLTLPPPSPHHSPPSLHLFAAPRLRLRVRSEITAFVPFPENADEILASRYTYGSNFYRPRCPAHLAPLAPSRSLIRCCYTISRICRSCPFALNICMDISRSLSPTSSCHDRL